MCVKNTDCQGGRTTQRHFERRREISPPPSLPRVGEEHRRAAPARHFERRREISPPPSLPRVGEEHRRAAPARHFERRLEISP